MSRSQPERQGSLHEPLPAEFRPNAAQAGTGSGWPGEQDWEILSAAVRAEADAAALKEHYQLGERGFCGFVHDMARKCSLRQVRLFLAMIQPCIEGESTPVVGDDGIL